MADHLPTIRGAVVQAAPVFLDRDQTTIKACSLIREAGNNGADIIVFPEGYIPTHPIWYHFLPATQRRATALSSQLFNNAVVIGGPVTDALGQAAADAGTWVVMGICEKRMNTTGTMWNSIVYISPEGKIAAVHRKIAPTTTEKLVHTGGGGADLMAVQTRFGPITGLLCGENSNPLLVFSSLAQYPVVHAAMWPQHFSKKDPDSPTMADVISNNAVSLAYQMGSFILSAAGTLDAADISTICESTEDLEWLSDGRNLGGSCIVSPSGAMLAGPLGSEEDILYADLRLGQLVPKKAMHDFGGHYNRADIFQLQISHGGGSILSAPWTSGDESHAWAAESPSVESGNYLVDKALPEAPEYRELGRG